MLTPYTGQLLLLRKALEKHTLVFLDEADQKIIDDMDTSGTNGSEQLEAASDAAQEPATNVCRDTVRRRVRLATVDNFQGKLLSQLVCDCHTSIWFLTSTMFRLL